MVHIAPPANRQSKDTRPRVTQVRLPATQTLRAAPDPSRLPPAPSPSALADRARLNPRPLLLPPPPSRRAPRERPPRPAPRASGRPPHPGTDARQPPRLWHYGHGGGDGSAEAEPAGHEGAGIVSAAFLSRTWRRRVGPGEAGPGRAGGGPGRPGAGIPGLRFRSRRASWRPARRRAPGCPARPVAGARPRPLPAVTGDRTGVPASSRRRPGLETQPSSAPRRLGR